MCEWLREGKQKNDSRVDHMVKEEKGTKQKQHTLYDNTNDYMNYKHFPLIYTASFRNEISSRRPLERRVLAWIFLGSSSFAASNFSPPRACVSLLVA